MFYTTFHLAFFLGLGLLALSWSTAEAQGSSRPTLKVASIESPPFLMPRDGGSNNAYQGFLPDLLAMLAKEANFQYTFRLPEKRDYGQLNETSRQFSGLIGELQKKKVDLVMADMTVTQDRNWAVDFSRPYLLTRITVLLKQNVPGQSFPFLHAFSGWTWVFFLLAYVVSSLVLWIVARISPFERKANVPMEAKYTLTACFWYMISLLLRGSNITPRTLSTRLLVLGWWMFFLLFVVFYVLQAGQLMRLFNREYVEDPERPRTLNELLDNFPDAQFGALKGGSTHQFLKGSSNPTLKRIFERLADDGLLSGTAEGKDLVDDNDPHQFGFVMEGMQAQRLMLDNCDLYTVGTLAQKSYALALQKGSRYTSMINQALLNIQEDGRLHMLKRKWWDDRSLCNKKPDADEKEVSQLSLTELDGLFLFLLVVLLLALIVSIVELACYVFFSDSPAGETKGKVCKDQWKDACCGCFSNP